MCHYYATRWFKPEGTGRRHECAACLRGSIGHYTCRHDAAGQCEDTRAVLHSIVGVVQACLPSLPKPLSLLFSSSRAVRAGTLGDRDCEPPPRARTYAAASCPQKGMHAHSTPSGEQTYKPTSPGSVSPSLCPLPSHKHTHTDTHRH